MLGAAIGVVLALALVAIVGGWVVAIYNALVTLRNTLENAWAQIDVQLKRRYDLIPNLVEAVKDYMGFEEDVLTKVTQARAATASAEGPAERAGAENMLTSALRSLFAVVENYPELKANQNVIALQEELTSTEDRIATARQFYNEIVRQFNTRIQRFPTNLVAGLLGFRAREFFAAEGDEREPVEVDLR